MKNNVSKIEKIIPVTNTIPIVSLDSYPAPDPIRRGATPITVENPVIIIAQSNIVDYEAYNSLGIERLDLYKTSVYPRMVRYKDNRVVCGHLSTLEHLSFVTAQVLVP